LVPEKTRSPTATTGAVELDVDAAKLSLCLCLSTATPPSARNGIVVMFIVDRSTIEMSISKRRIANPPADSNNLFRRDV